MYLYLYVYIHVYLSFFAAFTIFLRGYMHISLFENCVHIYICILMNTNMHKILFSRCVCRKRDARELRTRTLLCSCIHECIV